MAENEEVYKGMIKHLLIMPEEISKKVDIYKAIKGLNNKNEAILGMLSEVDIDYTSKKE